MAVKLLRTRFGLSCAIGAIASAVAAVMAWPAAAPTSTDARTPMMVFPEGTATPSEICGSCHVALFREYSEGLGTDLQWLGMKAYPTSAETLTLSEDFARSATAHSVAGVDPWPLEALQVEAGGRRCMVCHFPEPFDYPEEAASLIAKPTPRAASQDRGVTCASCHLTPKGEMRGPYDVTAPHATIVDDRSRTSVACAYCHSEGQRVIGKQTQTYFEWREDFSVRGLGPQQCQDCHMPKTIRKLAENFDVPERVVARHTWTGSHSFQRVSSALALSIVQPEPGGPELALHVSNVGAGHSVPTGSNRRALYLAVRLTDSRARVRQSTEWMFAPWFGNRPDDRAFLEEDKRGTDPIAAAQADAQGPHESTIRAGEERVLTWSPDVSSGRYVIEATLTYDLNRYNDRPFMEDQRVIGHAIKEVTITARKAATGATDAPQ